MYKLFIAVFIVFSSIFSLSNALIPNLSCSNLNDVEVYCNWIVTDIDAETPNSFSIYDGTTILAVTPNYEIVLVLEAGKNYSLSVTSSRHLPNQLPNVSPSVPVQVIYPIGVTPKPISPSDYVGTNGYFATPPYVNALDSNRVVVIFDQFQPRTPAEQDVCEYHIDALINGNFKILKSISACGLANNGSTYNKLQTVIPNIPSGYDVSYRIRVGTRFSFNTIYATPATTNINAYPSNFFPDQVLMSSPSVFTTNGINEKLPLVSLSTAHPNLYLTFPIGTSFENFKYGKIELTMANAIDPVLFYYYNGGTILSTYYASSLIPTATYTLGEDLSNYEVELSTPLKQVVPLSKLYPASPLVTEVQSAVNSSISFVVQGKFPSPNIALNLTGASFVGYAGDEGRNLTKISQSFFFTCVAANVIYVPEEGMYGCKFPLAIANSVPTASQISQISIELTNQNITGIVGVMWGDSLVIDETLLTYSPAKFTATRTANIGYFQKNVTYISVFTDRSQSFVENFSCRLTLEYISKFIPDPSATPSITPSTSLSPAPSASASKTPSRTRTPAATTVPSPDPTPSKSNTPSISDSRSFTPSATSTRSITMSKSLSATPTISLTKSITATISVSPTPTRTGTISVTQTPTKSISKTPSTSFSRTASISRTPTKSPSDTPSPTRSFSNTPSPIIIESNTPVPSVSTSPSVSSSSSLTKSTSLSRSPSISIEILPSQSAAPSFSPFPSLSPFPSAIVITSASATPTSSPSRVVTYYEQSASQTPFPTPSPLPLQDPCLTGAQIIGCPVQPVEVVIEQPVTEIPIDTSNGANTGSVTIPQGTVPKGYSIVLTPVILSPIEIKTNGIVSSTFDLTAFDAANNVVQISSAVEICLEVSSEVDKSKSCLGYLDESRSPPEWVCQDKCLASGSKSGSKNSFCGKTDHFTSFSILLTGTQHSCNNNHEQYIFDKQWKDLTLIGCTAAGIILFLCIVAIILMFLPKEVLYGKEGSRAVKLRSAKLLDSSHIPDDEEEIV